MINWLRQRFCKHDFEELEKVAHVYTKFTQSIPYEYEIIYRCKKCGYVQHVKF